MSTRPELSLRKQLEVTLVLMPKLAAMLAARGSYLLVLSMKEALRERVTGWIPAHSPGDPFSGVETMELARHG